MNNFICKNCNVIFKRKAHLKQHQNRKNTCEQSPHNFIHFPQNSANLPQKSANLTQNYYAYKNIINDNLENIENMKNIENIGFILKYNDLECKYCFKFFSRKDVLKRHILENCKIKKLQDKEKETIFKKLLVQEDLLKEKDEQINTLIRQNKIIASEMIELKDKINMITKKTKKNSINKKIKTNISNFYNTNTNINTTTNTITNSNNVVVQLVNYGNEDLDKIDIKEFFNAVVKNNKICGVKIPEEILKLIHFNPNYPELNNIYISDINREKYMIYDDGMWKLSPDDKIPEVMNKVVKFSYNKQDKLREKFKNNKPIIERLNVVNKYTQFTDIDYLEELKEEQDGDDIDNSVQIKRCEDFQKKTYNTFKTTIYNEGLKLKKLKK